MNENALLFTFGFLFVFLAGLVIGGSVEQHDSAYDYCISQEYQGTTKIDGEYFCFDDETLFKIEWID